MKNLFPNILGQYRGIDTQIKEMKRFSKEGRRKLAGLGIFTFEDIFNRLTKEELSKIQGIGTATANRVQYVAWEKGIEWGDKKPQLNLKKKEK